MRKLITKKILQARRDAIAEELAEEEATRKYLATREEAWAQPVPHTYAVEDEDGHRIYYVRVMPDTASVADNETKLKLDWGEIAKELNDG